MVCKLLSFLLTGLLYAAFVVLYIVPPIPCYALRLTENVEQKFKAVSLFVDRTFARAGPGKAMEISCPTSNIVNKLVYPYGSVI